jgi:hypothetical protein
MVIGFLAAVSSRIWICRLNSLYPRHCDVHQVLSE